MATISITESGGLSIKINSNTFILKETPLTFIQGDVIKFIIDGENEGFNRDVLTLDFNNIADQLGKSTPEDYIIELFKRTKATSSVNNDYTTEVALGNISGASIINKFGYNSDIDTGSEEIIASFGGTFDPTVRVMDTAQTFTITYNNTTDGSGTTGALSLMITYIDSNDDEITSFHTLGNTGSDITSFSGKGINRMVVLSSGSLGHNANDITMEATVGGYGTQAMIPALSSVTQQCLIHVPISKTLLLDFLFLNVLKLSGGGGSPRVTVKGYSWSRVTNTAYEIFDVDIDTSVNNQLVLNPNEPFVLTGREVFYFTATTDSNNTTVRLRFSGKLINS